MNVKILRLGIAQADAFLRVSSHVVIFHDRKALFLLGAFKCCCRHEVNLVGFPTFVNLDLNLSSNRVGRLTFHDAVQASSQPMSRLQRARESENQTSHPRRPAVPQRSLPLAPRHRPPGRNQRKVGTGGGFTSTWKPPPSPQFKMLNEFTENNLRDPAQLSDKAIQQISYQLDQRCRDVEY